MEPAAAQVAKPPVPDFRHPSGDLGGPPRKAPHSQPPPSTQHASVKAAAPKPSEEVAVPKQALQPKSSELRDKQRLAIGEAWKIQQKYALTFQSSLLLLFGQQSSGKTAFVERYLGYAFSVVKDGMATKRPALLVCLPQEHHLDDAVEVIEELEDGGLSPMLRFEGDNARSELQKWSQTKNDIPKPSGRKLLITIFSKDCRVPRRVMDMPGVRSNDEEGNEGFNEAIVQMVLKELKHPDSIIVSLAAATNDTSNDQMVTTLKKHRDELAKVNLHKRFRLVLTKSDLWFHSTNAQKVRDRVKIWQKECLGFEPMLVGSMIDPKEPDDCESRNRQYKTADAREEKSVTDFWENSLKATLADDQAFVKWWNEKVGFQNVMRIIEDEALDMDLTKFKVMIHEIQNFHNKVQDDRKKVESELKNNDPDRLRLLGSELVSAMLGDTKRFASASSGPGTELALSRKQWLKENSMTLEEEEADFEARRNEFSPDAMRIAMEAAVSPDLIDYTRSSEYAPGDFEDFYQRMKEDKEFMAGVPESGKKLTAGASGKRAQQFFERIVLRYMEPETEDLERIDSAYAINTDFIFCEDELSRVYKVLQIKAAKLREVALYFVQKVALMMLRCFSFAWGNMLRNKQYEPFIASLAAVAGKDHVYETLRLGFHKQLLVHAQKAYMDCINDHAGMMLQVGAFRKQSAHLHGLEQGVAVKSNNSLQTTFSTAMNMCLDSLEGCKDGFNKVYPLAHAGIMEGLSCVANIGFHSEVPGLTKFFVKGMIDKGILEKEEQEPKEQAVRGGAIANRLDRMDPEQQNSLLGFVAVVSAYFNPTFAKSVLARVHGGFLGSIDHTYYKFGYEQSMRQQLFEEFIEEEALSSRKRFLEDELHKLKEAEADCGQALIKLRRLVSVA